MERYPLKKKSFNKLDQAKPYLRPSSSSPSFKSTYKALDEFYSIYDSCSTTSCDFFIWRTYNQVYLPVTNLEEESNKYITTRRQYKEWSEEDKEINKKLERKCESAKFFTLRLENPRAFYEWCEQEYKVTLAGKTLSNKLIGGNAVKKELFERYRYLQGHFTQWKFLYENESIDIGNAFAKTITWDLIKAAEYNDPVLSFIIDLTKSQDELKSKIPRVVFNYAARVPNHYYDLPTQEFESLFNKFYSDKRNWQQDNFGDLNNEDKSQPFYLFMRDICKHLFCIWESGIDKERCSEATWGRIVIDPLMKTITKSLNKQTFWQWEGSGSLAPGFRKESAPNKPDFWVYIKIAGTIQEILYEEISGSPFVIDKNKFKSDLHKLFRFGHDSEQKLGIELIEENKEFLWDQESLYRQLCEVELFLIQAYSMGFIRMIDLVTVNVFWMLIIYLNRNKPSYLYHGSTWTPILPCTQDI
ncbi:hypothetical protein F8M41_004666 [Gigaspora margarita]|uniref:Uncharacterized protein n=1 Tax=Gigaspora margarita TaxID=4874 RepID=A0A8H3XAR1_GIGMA|nr:hypothetical protein F8M41_004666 [Gigaspora margarita]